MVKKESIHLTERDAKNIMKLAEMNKRFRFYVKLWQLFFGIVFITTLLVIFALLKLALNYLFG